MRSQRQRPVVRLSCAQARRILVETLEPRRLLSGFYTWDSSAHTLKFEVNANTDVTVTETGGVVTFTVDDGTIAASGGDITTGNGTSTVTFNSADIDKEFQLFPTGISGASTNNLTFSGPGSLTSELVVVTSGFDDDDTAGTISVTGGFSLTSSDHMVISTNRNIVVGSGSLVKVTNGGLLSIRANRDSTPNPGNFIGVDIQGTVQGDGLTEIDGTGGADAGTGSHIGVSVGNGGQVLATSLGSLTVNGTGGTGVNGSGVSENFGVLIDGSGSKISAENGSIDINGQGGAGSGGANAGVVIADGGLVESTGTAFFDPQINITGTGGSGTPNIIDPSSSNLGVLIEFLGSDFTPAAITSVDANISVTGTGGTGTGDFDSGIGLFGGSLISASGQGSIFLNGTGGTGSTQDYGVIILNQDFGAQLTANTGPINIQGKGGAGTSSEGISLSTASLSTTDAPINFFSDQMKFSASSISAPGNTVNLITRTTDGTVGIALGGADSSTQLGLTDDELDQITASSINVGSSVNDAAIAITNDITRSDPANFHLFSNSTITFSGGSIDTDGGTLALTPTDGTLPQTTGTDATAASVVVNNDLHINIASATADSGYDVLTVNGIAQLQSGDLVLTGSYVPQGGDVFTVVTGTSLFGTFSQAEGSVITFNGKDLHVHYTANSVQLIANSPPTADAGGTYTVPEGGSVQLDGTASHDAEQDASTLTYKWDLDNDGIFGETGAAAGNGDETGPSPTFQANGLDGDADYTVTLMVVDNGALEDIDTATVHVSNVAPTASLVAPADAPLNVSASFTLKATDPSNADTSAGFTYTIHWGDGSATQTVSGAGSGTPVSHTYSTLGTFTVTVTATDKDNAVSTPVSASVAVAGAKLITDPNNSSVKALQVAGTSGKDNIIINPVPGGAEAFLNNTSLGKFKFTGTLIVDGQAGNDTITVNAMYTGPQVLFGGKGADTITSGNGPAVIVGGDGADTLNGGNGRDVLVGGNGADTLNAGNGDDILIAGATTFDASSPANWKNWLAIQAEWNSGNAYATRIGHLRGTIAGGLNGSTLLITTGSGRTVLHDISINTLNGGNGLDWFLATPADSTDRQSGETKTSI